MTVIATLVVERDKGWLGRVRSCEIIVDGTARGTMRGRAISLALPPGRHVLRARSGRTESDEVTVHLGPGATVRVRARARPPHITPLD